LFFKKRQNFVYRIDSFFIFCEQSNDDVIEDDVVSLSCRLRTNEEENPYLIISPLTLSLSHTLSLSFFLSIFFFFLSFFLYLFLYLTYSLSICLCVWVSVCVCVYECVLAKQERLRWNYIEKQDFYKTKIFLLISR